MRRAGRGRAGRVISPGLKAGGYDAKGPGARLPQPAYDAAYDATLVKAHLEAAGRTLLALPSTGHSPRLRVSRLAVVQDMMEAYGWSEGRLRPPMPSAAAIDAMDRAYAWLGLIPDGKYVLRRIVAARSLVHPLSERHLYPWRRLGAALGADHKAVQRWWGQGIDLILAGLARR